METSSRIVSMRFSGEEFESLSGRANGTIDPLTQKPFTPGALAKSLVLAALGKDQETELHQLRLTVAELQRGTKKIREDVATLAEGLLVACTSGQAVSPEEAKEWTDKNLRVH